MDQGGTLVKNFFSDNLTNKKFIENDFDRNREPFKTSREAGIEEVYFNGVFRMLFLNLYFLFQ